VVPLATSENRILGVLQLINALDDEGNPVSFSVNDRLFISYFAQHAAGAIEKAELSRQMVLRMVEMAELRDPFETIPHAKRVGDYSLELYDKWAIRHNIPLNERNIKKDMFRTAAILHDVGKVAIADSILQKRGELNHEEKLEMQKHTIYGARLFTRKNSHWDKIAAEVALNHHERWDGTGYPGYTVDVHSAEIEYGPGKRGKDIPLSARIVAISDVYDALISKRAYKEPWKEETALTYIKRQAGKQFDPELVEIFLTMGEIIQAIRSKYVGT
jgi:response regulator RpfG family c-di-GMP phosphodiesterase